MGTRDDAQMALAQYLGCSPDELGEGNEYPSLAHNFTYGDEEYAVYEDYSDAEEDAKRDIIELIDEMGIEGFSPDFQDEIIVNGWLNTDWFDEAKDESNRFYADDIKEESASSPEYANRLIEEAVDRGLIDEDDLDESGNYVGDEDDLYERFVDDLNGDYSDSVEWYRDNFGSEINEAVAQNGLIDYDAVAEAVVERDGVANSLARYDSKENTFDYNGTTFYIYRT